MVFNNPIIQSNLKAAFTEKSLSRQFFTLTLKGKTSFREDSFFDGCLRTLSKTTQRIFSAMAPSAENHFAKKKILSRKLGYPPTPKRNIAENFPEEMGSTPVYRSAEEEKEESSYRSS